MLRRILTVPDPILREKSKNVSEITPEVSELGQDLIDTMLAAQGAGIAAVQVGVLSRVIAMIEQEGDSSGRPIVLVNPQIMSHSDETMSLEEGCLSMPSIFFQVTRWQTVYVQYTDLNSKEQTITASGYKAVVLQHEIDHLDGIRSIDRVSRLKREFLLKRFRRLKSQAPALKAKLQETV